MIAILDYGMGNLRSVEKALTAMSIDAQVTSDAAVAERAEGVILPGVGAFGDAMAGLHERGLTAVAKARALEALAGGRPFLGICLGMQVLVDGGEEDPGVPGLGVLRGSCPRLRPSDLALKVPHMGWNQLRRTNREGDRIFEGLGDAPWFYFVHSYHVLPEDDTVVAAASNYGGYFCASFAKANLFAMQFHPEKSQGAGLRLLRNFAGLCGAPGAVAS